jgi:branched-chain amino acid transport system ATP-binding protein|tara:strand:+ start:696 stop:1403 length:708 start_codon:yes stop_codon:yes gene_type:complete
MAESMLHIQKLCAYYGDFQALFDLDMHVNQGEVVAIIGANAAGKTTLMHSIAGLSGDQSKKIYYRGERIGALRADQVAGKGIALVPEGRQLFSSLTVEENLIIGGQIGRKGMWSLPAVYQLFPVLEERRAILATELSGGQQQMAAIARALMANPKLILFDEISLGLAPVVIKTIYDALPIIIREGVSVMIVEQDISKALQFSSRFYCLQKGRVALEGLSKTAQRDDISRAYFGVH